MLAGDSREIEPDAGPLMGVLPHLSLGRRGPRPTLALHKTFNYILQVLYMGCQWKMLPIESNAEGRPEINYTRIYRAFRRWQADGCMDAIFAGSVSRLHADRLLDLAVVHGDGTTTAAKKKAATTSVTAATSISRATRWCPSAIATAT
jgi:transposase